MVEYSTQIQVVLRKEHNANKATMHHDTCQQSVSLSIMPNVCHLIQHTFMTSATSCMKMEVGKDMNKMELHWIVSPGTRGYSYSLVNHDFKVPVNLFTLSTAVSHLSLHTLSMHPFKNIYFPLKCWVQVFKIMVYSVWDVYG